MKLSLREEIELVRRVHPLIDRASARFLYRTEKDRNRRSKKAVLLLLIWSDDGRASLHHTIFTRKRAMGVSEWAGWMLTNSRGVAINSVIPYLNRAKGSTWNIERAFGWYMPGRGR